MGVQGGPTSTLAGFRVARPRWNLAPRVILSEAKDLLRPGEARACAVDPSLRPGRGPLETDHPSPSAAQRALATYHAPSCPGWIEEKEVNSGAPRTQNEQQKGKRRTSPSKRDEQAVNRPAYTRFWKPPCAGVTTWMGRAGARRAVVRLPFLTRALTRRRFHGGRRGRRRAASFGFLWWWAGGRRCRCRPGSGCGR